ncbi:hypothetical protein ZWY2020_028380 [Hordeum vulgare]|nr:hypothetical protein ZWY2020_028380 [Hordeum vulgare]
MPTAPGHDHRVGDLVPLSYIAGLVTGRPNSMATAPMAQRLMPLRHLRSPASSMAFFELQPQGRPCHGEWHGGGLWACIHGAFEANILSLLAEVLSAVFCEVMNGKPEYTDHLTHKLKHHPGKSRLPPSWSTSLKLRELDPLMKPKQDRYALRTSPQWLGPQIEAIHGNFQAHPSVCPWITRGLPLLRSASLCLPTSELVNDFYNNGLPSNLSGGRNRAWTMASCRDCHGLVPFRTSILGKPCYQPCPEREQHNQDVNSLGLISSRKTAEAIDILKLMSSTFLVALCQAIDLRHLEENVKNAVKSCVKTVARKTLSTDNNGHLHKARFCEKDLLLTIDREAVFAYADDPCSVNYPLMQKMRAVLVEHASQWSRLPGAPWRMAPAQQNRISECRSYPLYRFVRKELGTEYLTGEKTRSPGEEVDKVFVAMNQGKHIDALLECLKEWNGEPLPIC